MDTSTKITKNETESHQKVPKRVTIHPTEEVGMLKSKNNNQNKLFLIKNMITDIYSPVKKDPKTDTIPEKGILQTKKNKDSFVRQEPLNVIPQKSNEEIPKIEVAKVNEKQTQRERNMKKFADISENLIMLLDESSKESTMLGFKNKGKKNVETQPVQETKDLKFVLKDLDGEVKSDEGSSGVERVDKSDDASDKNEPKVNNETVVKKHKSTILKLNTLLKKTNYYLEKMKKLNTHWDEARYDINKYTGQGYQMLSLQECIKKHGIKAYSKPDKLSRLKLNRLNFIIQKITQRPSRNYEQFSIFESYLILKLFVLPQNQPQTPFDTEAVVQILSDYLGREKQSIHTHKENLESNTKFIGLIDLVEYLLFSELGEDAQDFKFGRNDELMQIFEKEGTGVVRFSFLVDVFLLHFYILYNVTSFIDKMDMVLKIINALTNNNEFEIPQKYKMKTKWIKRVYYRTTKSKRRFISDYDFMIFNEEKYIEMISHFEQVIINKGWKKGLILTSFNGSPNISIDMTRKDDISFKLDESKDNILFGEDKDDNKMFLKQISSLTSKNKKKEKLQKNLKEDNDNNNIDISNKKDNYFLSKRELEIEVSHIEEQSTKKIKYNVEPSNEPNTEQENSKQKPINSEWSDISPENITFYQFGIDHIKKTFNFESVEVEDLLPKDKELLADLVNTKLNPCNKFIRSVLEILFQQKADDLKEYLRNCEITLRNLESIDLTKVGSKFAISVSHVFFKIERMIKFVREKCFFPNINAPKV
jgi:hypothetical protein